MKKFLPGLFCGLALSWLLLMLMGAAAPAPIQRNQWSTNVQGQPVIGDFTYTNAAAGTTNFWLVNDQGINSLAPGRSLWKGYSWFNSGGKAFHAADGFVQLLTNGAALMQAVDATVTPISTTGASGQGVDYLQVRDSAANVIGYFRTNAMWQTTNDFYALLTTTDATVTTIQTLTMRDNTTVQVSARVSAFNATTSASYWRVATFRSVAGTVTQVGATTAVSTGEDNAAMDCTIDTTANTIRIRATGIAATTILWKSYATLYYGE